VKQPMRGLYLLLLLFVLASLCSSQKVGVRVTINWDGLNYFRGVGIEVLEQRFKSLQIPDIDGSTSTPIGSIDYKLSKIELTQLSLPNSNISFDPPSGVSIDIINVAAHITLDWSYRESDWPHVSDSGSADVSVSSTTIAIKLVVGEVAGRPTSKTTACTVKIGNLDIDLHGGASWLYNLFVDLFSSQIKSSTESGLESALPADIDQGLGGILSTLPIEQPINSAVEINYELQMPPLVSSTQNCVLLNILGEFYHTQNPNEFPAFPSALPTYVVFRMAQIFVSEFTFNSVAYAFYNAGELDFTLTNSMIPSDIPFRLNTSDFAGLVPPLAKAYPNQLFSLHVSATKTPNAVFTSKGAFVTAYGAVDVLIQPKGVLAFTLGVEVLSAGSANFLGSEASSSQLVLSGKLSFLNLTLSLLSTNIGPFNVSLLNDVMGDLVTGFAIPEANKYLAGGFPLPAVAGLSYNNPVLGWGDSYIYVASDVTFVPPSEANSSTNRTVKVV